MARAYDPWGSAKRHEIALAISAAPEGGLTAPQLAGLLGGRPQNLKTQADALVGADLLATIPAPPRPAGQVGRWPEHAYVLTDDGRAALASTASSPRAAQSEDPAEPRRSRRPRTPPVDPAGSLQASQQIVWADVAEGALPELFHALDGAHVVGRAAWAAIVDGPEQEYAIAFAGERAAADALELLAILTGARIAARRTVVSDVIPTERLRQELTDRAELARRARMARDTREAS